MPGQPSLIPLPQFVKYTKEDFSLNKCAGIFINNNSLRSEAAGWNKMIDKNIPVKLVSKALKKDNYSIELNLGKVVVDFGNDEAYHLIVRSNSIRLTANTTHGIFNGLQTLYQLIGSNGLIAGCDITDFPAYQWRGYMIDVGRNFQSVEQIKQQIDIMSKYKLNVFHFHLTEDIAWRLQIKNYPQLTSPEFMLRDKGKYYSIAQMKDLIQYCKERFITLVPEIDMPGHSKAFTRAMGVDMQSDSGSRIIKNIISEICTTYDLSYLHIGADEVAIRNKQFIPEITKLIHGYHIKTIGWSPGGNYDKATIRQLWGSDESESQNVKHFDSKALYLSDMAPESGVVSIFNRQLGGKIKGDSNLSGAEICLWDDRKMANEKDHLTMNAVYPFMLAFGERSWRGGGEPGLDLTIGTEPSERAKEFAEFEKRLIVHKREYFTQLPFPYVKQSHIKWKLIGPFENEGNLSASFWPEKKDVSPEDSSNVLEAVGGTIWLWYHNGETYKTWLPSPKKNTTWYAYTKFWSDADTTISMWIGFKNLLRSLASATPPAGEWDYKKPVIKNYQSLVRH